MAQHDILINWTPQETRVALIEQAAVQEVLIERSLERGLVGNIYVGRVQRVLPGMQSAFIDIGLERTAFLHVADMLPHLNARHAPPGAGEAPEPPPPIERQVFEGQSLLVQVLKDPIGSKGARLTAQISIAGRLLVFLPQDNHIGVSQKIPAAQRDALRQRLAALVGEGGGGFILRTNAEDASDEELADDIAYLRKTWARIREQANRVAPPALVYEELALPQRVLRDLVGPQTRSIQIDSREQFAVLQAFAQEYTPQVAERLTLYRGERPLFEQYRVDEEIDRALGRRVDLKSGGYLVFDQTEALTTIDVNTGAFVGARNFDDTVFRTNLEAAQAIARQLRLRNLGGIIIIDFIDMVRDDHREAVLAELRKQLARDRVKTMIGGFSPLGLVEMTRKRTRESLAQMLTEPCPACDGRGRVRTTRTVCYDILREILREARAFNPREFRIIAAPQVIERFLDEESPHLAGLSDFIGKPISLQSDNAMTQEQYDIVLL
ncbi:ribonuclease G [Tepidimonas taiwanensis]|uniref:Ribonuclease G n=1 Tax=Tepidimonas taiwanensis TaxID=307486 RepID=A0A554XBA1_9BURK|nr:ribonuclease G [Tepidimonas taiwanensis]MCX7693748.1 ribonuclease G [Tepidimonas taiwanensis]MDM7462089.1 ribonuclease G [Tepidimonas taiwanensis]TSE33122.1 Ribonuclease G [Tepidimonas taiwanensis]UBQ05972.1 ribonuclease G [Tepidimonas taiwanensis]